MYIDLLTKIMNAQRARLEGLKSPFSEMDMAVSDLLVKHGYLESAAKKGRMPKRIIEIKLKYKDDKGVIQGIKFSSKPSRRLYAGYKDLRLVRHGFGTGFLSTPKGILSYSEARREKVGGELLFEIW